MTDFEPMPWLNGWARHDLTTLLMGSGVHCIGCGRLLGVISVVFTADWSPPPEPAWPFRPMECPVCSNDAPARPVREVRVADIEAGNYWLLEGTWVRVVNVVARDDPGSRVAVTYVMDGEQFTNREYRGNESAAVAGPA